jgi:hypothetical protein
MQGPTGDPGDTTTRYRPSAVRGITGLLALALVVALEVASGHDARPTSASPEEAGATSVAVAPTLPPAPPIAAAPFPPPPTAPDDSPAASEAAPPAAPEATPARLLIDFEHGIRDGTLAVLVDGQPRIRQPLRSRVTGRLLSLEFRHGRVRRWLDVPAGTRRIRVQVQWGDHSRSDVAVGTFREGRPRVLVARLAPVTRALRLDWQ